MDWLIWGVIKITRWTLWEAVRQQQTEQLSTASARIDKWTVKPPVKVSRPKLIAAMRCARYRCLTAWLRPPLYVYNQPRSVTGCSKLSFISRIEWSAILLSHVTLLRVTCATKSLWRHCLKVAAVEQLVLGGRWPNSWSRWPPPPLLRPFEVTPFLFRRPLFARPVVP